MEQDVHTTYSSVCSTCLSRDRYVYTLNESHLVYQQVFRLLMHDFEADRFGDQAPKIEQTVCWECLAIMKKFSRFKNQVHNAQEHLYILAMSRTQETMDHTYMSQSLSTLEAVTKRDYDKIYLYYTQDEWPQSFIVNAGDVKNEQYDVAQAVRDNIQLNIDDHVLEVPAMVLENPTTGVMSRVVVDTDALVSTGDSMNKRELNIDSMMDNPKIEVMSHVKSLKAPTEYVECLPGTEVLRDRHYCFIMAPMDVSKAEDTENKSHLSTDKILGYTGMELTPMRTIEAPKLEATDTKPNITPKKLLGYTMDYMTEEELNAMRSELKNKIQYASSAYKCELCIIGFYTQQQVEDHFLSDHRAKPGKSSCSICCVYIDDSKLISHQDSHYFRYTCKMCGHREYSERIMSMHVKSHTEAQVHGAVIRIGSGAGKSKKKAKETGTKPPPKPGDLRKLLSKTTIEGYQCLECDMFFKNSRTRKTHVARCHREGFQCDHCKKRFVNKTTLATHLRLHEGPLPREECPICHKMVRKIQLKYHIQRHQNKKRYECVDCNKIFSHLATYQGHLKYSRAHASDQIFKFPCPMCNKGYPTKESMQDHFNYQHLGKTSHKCPICDKPIASRANVEKHIMRVHGQKKEKPRKHVCQICDKGFTDKKALNQHEVIHSGERPLTCDICQQTFKQKASLYTHRKRVHKVFPAKRLVRYVEPTTQN
ncbi:hypothetical protein evm_009308 [Chilo suppressalis]|nr:hypothetical protein evm_009308 [Chilo suppressalis]